MNYVTMQAMLCAIELDNTVLPALKELRKHYFGPACKHREQLITEYQKWSSLGERGEKP